MTFKICSGTLLRNLAGWWDGDGADSTAVARRKVQPKGRAPGGNRVVCAWRTLQLILSDASAPSRRGYCAAQTTRELYSRDDPKPSGPPVAKHMQRIEGSEDALSQGHTNEDARDLARALTRALMGTP